ncbi:MAG: hypothetical protein LC122_13845 [Chitinophagales bacterium]|nr:hypothetical protein [Chitinophagales bacterium]
MLFEDFKKSLLNEIDKAVFIRTAYIHVSKNEFIVFGDEILSKGIYATVEICSRLQKIFFPNFKELIECRYYPISKFKIVDMVENISNNENWIKVYET